MTTMNTVLDISKIQENTRNHQISLTTKPDTYTCTFWKPPFIDFWNCYRTNVLKVIIVTDILYYYNDYAEYSSRRLEMQAILKYILL